jgi:multiple sugar transport system substrate-binding protein
MREKRKKRAKQVFAAIVAVAAVLSAGGCSVSNVPGGEKQKTVIRVLSTNRSTMTQEQERIDKFNRENTDNITIEYEVKGDDLDETLKVLYNSNNPPDIHPCFGLANTEGALQNGWLRPLSDDIVQFYKEALIDPDMVKPFTDGKYYTVAVGGGSGFKMLWNKQLFAESGLDPDVPPKTFDELRRFAKSVTEKGGGQKYGFALPLKDAIFTRYYAMMPGAPSGLYNNDGYDPNTGEYDFTVYERMIRYLKDIIADGSAFPTPNSTNNDMARAQFAEGNIGIIYAAGWDVDVYNSQFIPNFDWGIADFPTFDGFKGGNPYGMGNGKGNVMSAVSKHPDEQLKVWQWQLSENEIREKMLAYGAASLPAYKSLQDQSLLSSNKKGAFEFSRPVYPLHVIDRPDAPLSQMKLDGQDGYNVIKNLIIGNGDVANELREVTGRYNAAIGRARDEGKDVDRYKIPDYNFYKYE